MVSAYLSTTINLSERMICFIDFLSLPGSVLSSLTLMHLFSQCDSLLFGWLLDAVFYSHSDDRYVGNNNDTTNDDLATSQPKIFYLTVAACAHKHVLPPCYRGYQYQVRANGSHNGLQPFKASTCSSIIIIRRTTIFCTEHFNCVFIKNMLQIHAAVLFDVLDFLVSLLIEFLLVPVDSASIHSHDKLMRIDKGTLFN